MSCGGNRLVWGAHLIPYMTYDIFPYTFYIYFFTYVKWVVVQTTNIHKWGKILQELDVSPGWRMMERECHPQLFVVFRICRIKNYTQKLLSS